MNELTKIPSNSHSQWLQSEIERIDTQMRPATRANIAERIKVVLAALASQDKGASEDLRAQAYVFALEEVPLHVLDGVIKDVLQGRISEIDPVFAPTPPQLARICRERTEAMRAQRTKRASELARECAPLAIEESLMPSEEECARLAAKCDVLVAHLDRTAAEDELRKKEANPVQKALRDIAEKARDRARQRPAA